jgi:hypothetical protein
VACPDNLETELAGEWKALDAKATVPKGRLKVAQDVVLGTHELDAKSRRDG